MEIRVISAHPLSGIYTGLSTKNEISETTGVCFQRVETLKHLNKLRSCQFTASLCLLVNLKNACYGSKHY